MFENVAFGLRLKQVKAKDVKAAVQAALHLVRLDHYDSREISALSGGRSSGLPLLGQSLINRKSCYLMSLYLP